MICFHAVVFYLQKVAETTSSSSRLEFVVNEWDKCTEVIVAHS